MNRSEIRAAMRERANARRTAEPEPVYPVDRPAGQRIGRLVLELDGIATVELTLLAPKGKRGARPRCDQVGVADGDEILSLAAGKTAVLEMLASRWPHQPSRRTLAGMQTMHTSRDAADCAWPAATPAGCKLSKLVAHRFPKG